MLTPAFLSSSCPNERSSSSLSRIRRAADDRLAFFAQRRGLLALAERVVEHDNVGPVYIFLPVFGFGDEPVSDVVLFFVADEVADLVAFLRDLPGDVADQAGERDEQEILFLHGTPILHERAARKMLLLG